MSKSGQYYYRQQEAADFEDTDNAEENTIPYAERAVKNRKQHSPAKPKAIKYPASTPDRNENRGQFRGGDRSAQ